MKSLILGALLLLSWPTAAAAQTHPCDLVITQNPTITGARKVGFCFANKLTDDSVNTAPVTVKIYIGTNTTPTVTALLTSTTFVASSTANAAGFKYYETASTLSFPIGTTSFRVTVATATSPENSSAPFALSVAPAPLEAPVGLRIAGS